MANDLVDLVLYCSVMQMINLIYRKMRVKLFGWIL